MQEKVSKCIKINTYVKFSETIKDMKLKNIAFLDKENATEGYLEWERLLRVIRF